MSSLITVKKSNRLQRNRIFHWPSETRSFHQQNFPTVGMVLDGLPRPLYTKAIITLEAANILHWFFVVLLLYFKDVCLALRLWINLLKQKSESCLLNTFQGIQLCYRIIRPPRKWWSLCKIFFSSSAIHTVV